MAPTGTPPSGGPPGDLVAQLAELLTCASWRLRRARRRARPLGLTFGQARALRLLSRAGEPLRIGELAARLEVVPRSATARSMRSRAPRSWPVGPTPSTAGRCWSAQPSAGWRCCAPWRRPPGERRGAVRAPLRQQQREHLLELLSRPERGATRPPGSARPPMMGPDASPRSARCAGTSGQVGKIAKGTTRRILDFVAPYRGLLAVFLVLVVLDAVVSAANPLFYREIINKGILGQGRRAHRRGSRCSSPPWRSTMRPHPGAALHQRPRRRGPHLRHAHAGLRPRAAHAARLLHPHADRCPGQPAEQRRDRRAGGVHRRAVDRGRQPHQRRHRAGRHVRTLVAAHAGRLVLLPVFLLPARWLGRRLQAITRESYDLSADMNTTMVERFNVSGALLVKLFGRPRPRDESFRRAGRPRARHRRHAGACTRASSSSRCC